MDQKLFKPIYTVGHSIHQAEHFNKLLLRHQIEVVLDVRSLPSSRRAPQFNRSNLQASLNAIGVRYSFGGRTLGGRPDDPNMYRGMQVSYELMASSEPFLASVRRVMRGAKSGVIALLCAEADPIECHRFLLIGRALHVRRIDVRHILADGSLMSHAEGENRLLVATKLSQADAFRQPEDAVSVAYDRQAARYAFVRPIAEYRSRQLESA